MELTTRGRAPTALVRWGGPARGADVAASPRRRYAYAAGAAEKRSPPRADADCVLKMLLVARTRPELVTTPLSCLGVWMRPAAVWLENVRNLTDMEEILRSGLPSGLKGMHLAMRQGATRAPGSLLGRGPTEPRHEFDAIPLSRLAGL